MIRYDVQCQFEFNPEDDILKITTQMVYNDSDCNWDGFSLKVISNFKDESYVIKNISKTHIIAYNLIKDMT